MEREIYMLYYAVTVKIIFGLNMLLREGNTILTH